MSTESALDLVDTESGTEGALVAHSPAGELAGCLVTSDPSPVGGPAGRRDFSGERALDANR